MRIFCLLLVPALVGMAPAPLWDAERSIPSPEETIPIADVKFAFIKPFEPDRDGYRWLHGVTRASHNGKLYASYGANTGGENTDTERVQIRASSDGGFTWSSMAEIVGGDGQSAVSHGDFGDFDGSPHASFGSFRGFRQDVHMRVYVLDESESMEAHVGFGARCGFWPMAAPIESPRGDWMIPGITVVTARYGISSNPAASDVMNPTPANANPA